MPRYRAPQAARGRADYGCALRSPQRHRLRAGLSRTAVALAAILLLQATPAWAASPKQADTSQQASTSKEAPAFHKDTTPLPAGVTHSSSGDGSATTGVSSSSRSDRAHHRRAGDRARRRLWALLASQVGRQVAHRPVGRPDRGGRDDHARPEPRVAPDPIRRRADPRGRDRAVGDANQGVLRRGGAGDGHRARRRRTASERPGPAAGRGRAWSRRSGGEQPGERAPASRRPRDDHQPGRRRQGDLGARPDLPAPDAARGPAGRAPHADRLHPHPDRARLRPERPRARPRRRPPRCSSGCRSSSRSS